jgi:protocatechuate 4,5-dioxygenase beta chain
VADLVAVLATTHNPFYLRATTGDERHPQADAWVGKVETHRRTLEAAAPDVLVIVGSDHVHGLFPDNMPAFLVGKAPFFDATFSDEERQFGLPRMLLRGDADLADWVLRFGLERGIDFSFSNELRLDHSTVCPMLALRPQADLPVVPVLANVFCPPMPPPHRFHEVGRLLGEAIRAYPSSARVAAVGTGHLSLELGGPRQFGEHPADPAFDQRALRWIRESAVDEILAHVTLESLDRAGNATRGFLTFLTMLGMTDGRRADHADHLDLVHTTEVFFTWYPREGQA